MILITILENRLSSIESQPKKLVVGVVVVVVVVIFIIDLVVVVVISTFGGNAEGNKM